jgi:hypothetical protein
MINNLYLKKIKKVVDASAVDDGNIDAECTCEDKTRVKS